MLGVAGAFAHVDGQHTRKCFPFTALAGTTALTEGASAAASAGLNQTHTAPSNLQSPFERGGPPQTSRKNAVGSIEVIPA